MKVLVTAGPTREPIDPVRFLTNRSSGKMGYTLAGAFVQEGHSVMLISGPTHLDVPENVDFIPVETAAEMHEVVSRYIGKMDVAVFAAAVADYTPAAVEPRKIKKSGDTLTLELVRTADILGSARQPFGFTGTLAQELIALTQTSDADIEILATKHHVRGFRIDGRAFFGLRTSCCNFSGFGVLECRKNVFQFLDALLILGETSTHFVGRITGDLLFRSIRTTIIDCSGEFV